MICPHCGRYLEDGVVFCIYCGQRLGKYADDAAEASQTVNLSDNAGASSSARGAAASSDGRAAAAGAAGAAAAGAAAAAAPVAPASAQEAAHATPTRGASGRPSVSGRGTRGSSRLHSDDEIAKRMNEIDDAPSTNRGRKVVAGVLLAALAAGAIGVGANYVVPSILDNGSSSSSSQASSSSSDSKSTSSKSDSKSTKSSKSSKSTSSKKSSQSATADTKRGSTLERANAEEGTESAADTAASAETVEAVPTTGEETTTGIVNTYTPSSTPASSGSGNSFANANATATSISPTESGITHGPDLVLDGLAYTAWNTNLNGVGQSITLSVDSAQAVSGLRVMNGYNKVSTSGTDLYYANARAHKILVEYEGGSKEFWLQDYKGEYQILPFDSTVNTSWIKITIKSVFPGNLYEDCCISEIEVY